MVGFIRSLALLAATMWLAWGADSLIAQSHSRTASIRAAQSRSSRIAPLPSVAHRAQQRMAMAQDVPQPSAPILGSPETSGRGVVGSDPIVGGGSPVVSDGYFADVPIAGGVYQGVAGSCMTGGCHRGCDSAMGGFSHDLGPAAGPCGYPMGYPCCYPWGQCLSRGISMLFRNTEFLGGAQAFRSRSFFAGDQLIDDSSFGFYGGANTIVPLIQPLTCGLFSGQIGVRSVQSEFDGDNYSSDNRNQTFVTAALYRQVDCGLRFGAAFDYLREEWISEVDLAQIRGDIGWAWPGGCIFGFRFAAGTEDDQATGIGNDIPFNLLVEAVDNYRFYYRMPAINAGYFDLFAGWSDDSDAVLGMDFDLPITPCWGMQSGFTYFLPDDLENSTDPIVQRDAWNVFVGVVFRPQGCFWYNNCNRPMFNVADNGTFVIRR